MERDAVDIYNQGYYYYTGSEGYPLNYNKAMRYFQEAAELGFSEAMNYLGIIYENGEIVAQNYNQAFEWFFRAVQADPKNANATFNLARMYYEGKGVERNMVQAHRWFNTSVELGTDNTEPIYIQSCFMTGCILSEFYKNYEEAYPYFIEAAQYGNMSEAWFNLGWLTEQGIVPEGCSYTKAEIDQIACEMYEQAAQQGDVSAMDSAGRIYASYNMYDEARPWIERAASLGYEPAKKRLKMLNVAQSGSMWGYFK